MGSLGGVPCLRSVVLGPLRTQVSQWSTGVLGKSPYETSLRRSTTGSFYLFPTVLEPPNLVFGVKSH